MPNLSCTALPVKRFGVRLLLSWIFLPIGGLDYCCIVKPRLPVLPVCYTHGQSCDIRCTPSRPKAQVLESYHENMIQGHSDLERFSAGEGYKKYLQANPSQHGSTPRNKMYSS